ncbi:MAG: hypothetical protein AABX59_00085 [Nanoarchaeota archaeon]
MKIKLRLGLESVGITVIYHASMYEAKLMEVPKEEREKWFPNESLDKREILLGILERVVAGEDLPDF